MRNVFRRAVAGALLGAIVLTATPIPAVEPDEMLKDPMLEARAREISKDLRCLVCQNQSIDDSNAPLARDLRLLVRDRLKAGDTNAEAVDFIVARYGDFVLLDPPFKAGTLLLWLGPALVLLAGAAGIAVWYRRRARESTEPAPLTEDERRRLAALTGREGGSGGSGA